MSKTSLTNLKNIGETLALKLNEIDIKSESELIKVGSVKAYQWLSESTPSKKLPLCYYLYSLEGAILGKYWRDLTENEKDKLRLKAGLKK